MTQGGIGTPDDNLTTTFAGTVNGAQTLLLGSLQIPLYAVRLGSVIRVETVGHCDTLTSGGAQSLQIQANGVTLVTTPVALSQTAGAVGLTFATMHRVQVKAVGAAGSVVANTQLKLIRTVAGALSSNLEENAAQAVDLSAGLLLAVYGVSQVGQALVVGTGSITVDF